MLISTEPVFSEGAVFSSSLSTNTLAMSFYNKDVLPLVGALLSTRLTNFKGRSSVGEVQLLQMEVPSYLQVSPLALRPQHAPCACVFSANAVPQE